MKTLLQITLTALLALTSATLSAQEWTAEQKEVWQVVENNWKNLQAGNVDQLFLSFHEKYQGWSTSQPLPLSKDLAMQLMQPLKDVWKISDCQINPARITVVGNAAVVHYYFRFTFVITAGEEKNSTNPHGKYTEFYVKENGKWLCLGDMTVHVEE